MKAFNWMVRKVLLTRVARPLTFRPTSLPMRSFGSDSYRTSLRLRLPSRLQYGSGLVASCPERLRGEQAVQTIHGVYTAKRTHLTRLRLCSWHVLWTATKSIQLYSPTRKQKLSWRSFCERHSCHAIQACTRRVINEPGFHTKGHHLTV